jgi:hypothetical protein
MFRIDFKELEASVFCLSLCTIALPAIKGKHLIPPNRSTKKKLSLSVSKINHCLTDKNNNVGNVILMYYYKFIKV